MVTMDNQFKRLWYIAQAHSYFPSTYANNYQVMKMCSAFAGIGLHTTLVVPRRLSTGRAIKNLRTSLWDFYGVPPNFEIAWLPFPYPVSKFQRTVHALSIALYALVHRISFAYTRSEWVAIFLSRMGVPTILEVHHPAKGQVQRIAARVACDSGYFFGLVCVSRVLAERMVELGFPEHKVMVASDGVDLARFEPRLSQTEARTILNLPRNGKIVCHLGSLYPGRGIEILLKSAETLPDIIFLLVGGLPLDIRRYQDQVREQGLKNVRFMGVVPNSLVPTCLYAADVVVMPYTDGTPTHQYMSPMKMFEYMAAGRPIVTSDFPVLREVLRPDETALLVPPSDATALASAIRRVSSDIVMAKRLGQQALEDVRAYTWENRAQRILNFIQTAYWRA